jgi:hypothetical protein
VSGNAKDYRKKEEQTLAETREKRFSGNGRRSGTGGSNAPRAAAAAGGVEGSGVSTRPLLQGSVTDAASEASARNGGDAV